MEAKPASKLASTEPSSARRNARVRVLLSAKLVTTTDETNVTIRDVSLSGAMVQARFLPRVGSDLILARGSFEIFAAVIWCRGDMCGVEFDSPLSSLEELLDAGATHANLGNFSSAFRHDPLGTPATLDADAIEAATNWAFPVGPRAALD